MLYSYRRIVELAAPRPVTIFVIPSGKDFAAFRKGHFKGRIVEALAGFAATQRNLRIVDLMPFYQDYLRRHGGTYNQFFLKYNPHWSPLGHGVAAEAVLATERDLLSEKP